MRDHLLELYAVICFDWKCDNDSRIETAISLASPNSVTTLQLSWLAKVDLLLIFLNLLQLSASSLQSRFRIETESWLQLL